ncbi:MAG: hypothetical protein FVQ83_02830 [Chloroflexi bacterium]|nr:hypothetical protein [Chloroflexota bacterium]
MRDAYLEAWTGFANRRDLLSAFDLAHHIGKLSCAYYWYSIITSIIPASIAKFSDYPPGWLWEFLHHKAG